MYKYRFHVFMFSKHKYIHMSVCLGCFHLLAGFFLQFKSTL